MTTTEGKRVFRTPAQKAQDAVDAQQRVLQRQLDKVEAAQAALDLLKVPLAEMRTRLAYLQSSPDLPTQPELFPAEAE